MDTAPRLCEHCQRWNVARDALGRNNFLYWPQEEGEDTRTVEAYLEIRDCVLCQLLVNAVLERLRADLSVKDYLSIKIRNCGPSHFIEGRHVEEEFWSRSGDWSVKCAFSLVVAKDPEEYDLTDVRARALDRDYIYGVPTILHYAAAGSMLTGIEAWDEMFLPIAKLKGLMETCNNEHTGLCNAEDRNLPRNFRLIDTHSCNVVEVPCSEETVYAALSYVWASAGEKTTACLLESHSLERFKCQGSLTAECTPAVIWDAMILTRDLGIQFLWTDRLCILQDNDQDFSSQINVMDQIYRAAALTIVSVVDPNPDQGLPGVAGRPRRSQVWDRLRVADDEGCYFYPNASFAIDDSNWNTRGWTFQERLMSRRCIYISNFQAYYVCFETQYQEDFGIVDFSNNAKVSMGWHGKDLVKAVNDLNSSEDFLDYIEHYTARNLSDGKDILRAFTGVSNVIAAQWKTKFHYGLPEKYFMESQLFAPTTTKGRRRDVPNIPSWSWAAWEGHVRYDGLHKWRSSPSTPRYFGSLVLYHISQGENGLTRLKCPVKWLDEEVGIDMHPCKSELDRDLEQKIYGKFGPTEFFQDCPHNPFEARLHLELDPRKVAIAEKYPGALVFNTTTIRISLGEIEIEKDRDGDEVSIAILNQDGKRIGQLMSCPKAWLESWLDKTASYKILVLNAAVNTYKAYYRAMHKANAALEENGGRAWTRKQYYPSALEYLGEFPEMYVLHVMLVERENDGDGEVYERVAVGWVYMIEWKGCKPEWETVVVV